MKGERGSNTMNITDVRVRKIAKEGKMKAVVSITLDDEFVVHDIKVIEGEKGLFIAMPSRKATDGEYRDIAHPGSDSGEIPGTSGSRRGRGSRGSCRRINTVALFEDEFQVSVIFL